MTEALIDPVVFNPYDYHFHDDPYPTYKRLREESPLYHNPDVGFWALSRYADVVDGFKDNKRLSSANGVSLDPAAYGPHAHYVMSFLAMDDPRHMRLRQLVSRGFTPRRVAELDGRILELTKQHLVPALGAGEFDWITEVAGKLPMDVISELMGVPEPDRAELRRKADLVVHREAGVLDVPQPAVEASISLMGYYKEMIAQRRRSRTDDLTSALLDAEIDGDKLSDQEILGFMFLMVVAGNETTTKLLGNALYWGSHHREQITPVLDDPERASEWVEETLRYDTSSQIVARTSVVDLEYHGRTIPAGEKVLLLIGSANRDADVFDDADSFQIGRSSSGKLASFGGGVHFCLGAHLAKLEAKIALAEFGRRVSDYEVVESGIERVHSTNVRGFAALPVKVQVR
ncbi:MULTISPECIES: cytochrome P450 [Rhodococcus]|uniref:cytochrome P450 n=1 Tax=Rhodococcus TaxID=1827 RepID=UPI0009377C09|nr:MULTISPECIES: cytochrome P450 [Rhodococcus]OKA12484.1 cytochrome [Rhodococcus erythropolis]MBX9151338.1 cytochrome P450 [Rhodococcus qingshengii]MCZ4547410.1 cytochrome P450 [Rhodococcus qingshengii]QOS63047.1 cytochrome P450 [Rhodococcus qingshengii]QPG92095.1 cytochrome P450 [Rhodococcus qingshengii]